MRHDKLGIQRLAVDETLWQNCLVKAASTAPHRLEISLAKLMPPLRSKQTKPNGNDYVVGFWHVFRPAIPRAVHTRKLAVVTKIFGRVL